MSVCTLCLWDGNVCEYTILIHLTCAYRFDFQIKNNEQANRMEIYEKTIEVLGPEVEKAKEFLRFMQKAATSFTDEVKTLSHPERRRDFISEYYLLTLARLVNMFSTLDALKNMKACINNDLACYRRCVPQACIIHT